MIYEKISAKETCRVSVSSIEMNISKLRLYQTVLVQMQNDFAEMFLIMLSNKTCLNDFAPPNKLAARAVDKNYL